MSAAILRGKNGRLYRIQRMPASNRTEMRCMNAFGAAAGIYREPKGVFAEQI